MSRLGRLQYLINSSAETVLSKELPVNIYLDALFSKITGSHPVTNVFHHQWAMNRELLNFSKRYLMNLPSGASILDVGVGSAPYWNLRPDLKWSGIDVLEGPKVNFVVNKDSSWPIASASLDYILCTQVIEHVENPVSLVSEIKRVLKPGGSVILNAPFLYPFHGMPNDQLRFTTSQLRYLFRDFEVLECGTLGGVGSSIATIWLNFINYKISEHKILQLIERVFFPIWLLGNATTNFLLVSIDKFDKTSSFPLNSYIIASLPPHT
jgi:SAM-dependent methyltransferase